MSPGQPLGHGEGTFEVLLEGQEVPDLGRHRDRGHQRRHRQVKHRLLRRRLHQPPNQVEGRLAAVDQRHHRRQGRMRATRAPAVGRCQGPARGARRRRPQPPLRARLRYEPLPTSPFASHRVVTLRVRSAVTAGVVDGHPAGDAPRPACPAITARSMPDASKGHHVGLSASPCPRRDIAMATLAAAPHQRIGCHVSWPQASTACVDDAGVTSVLVVPLSRGQGRPQAAGGLVLDAGGGGGPEFSDNGSGPAPRAGPHSLNRRSIRRPPRSSTTAGQRRGGR